jgi:hypothetical protein
MNIKIRSITKAMQIDRQTRLDVCACVLIIVLDGDKCGGGDEREE